MGLAHTDLAPLNSDAEVDRMDWSELEAKFVPFAAPAAGTKIGGVSKTLQLGQLSIAEDLIIQGFNALLF
jgi:ribose transport system substrate-binding protein